MDVHSIFSRKVIARTISFSGFARMDNLLKDHRYPPRLRAPSGNPMRVDDLRWKGPRPEFKEFCRRLKSPALVDRARTAQKKATQVA
jgi:hypothetical protein